jgi:organic hydroperoxide reductase OsmC/OhrA
MTLDQSATGGATHEETFAIELVWDADQEATAVPWRPPWEGSVIQVGPKAGWLPAHLVTLAAASGFMSTLLQLATVAGVSILGYVSMSKLHVPTDRRLLPTITLAPCIVVASTEDADKVAALCQQASDLCEVCRALQGRLEVVPDTQVITPAGEDSLR